MRKKPDTPVAETRSSAPAVRGDFDRNGAPDLLWQRGSNGEVRLDLHKTGADFAVQGLAVLNTGIPNWRLVSSADFDANGTPDLIWRDNASRQVIVHYYSGGVKPVNEGWKHLNATGIPGWSVAATADFDGNGTPDLVWQHEATREVSVHYCGGDKGAVMQNWADFDGNKTPDLVLSNDSTRQLTVHLYGGEGGAVLQRWAMLNANGNPGWSAVVPR